MLVRTERLLGFLAAPGSRLAPSVLAVLGLGGGLVLVAPSAAQAQSRTEGPGFRLGDFELHPGLAAEVGWDSNLYYTEDNPPAGRGRVDSGILRVTPHISISTISQQRRTEGADHDAANSSPPTVTFRGDLAASYYEFFAAPERRNLDINGGLRLNVLPERPFGFSIYDYLNRSVRPFTENFAPTSAARIGNRAGVDLNFQTDGSVLQFRLNYEFGLDFFEGDQFQFGNSFNHHIGLQQTFRFLPQTAIVQDTSVDITDYYNTRVGGAQPVNVSDNVRLQTRIGLNGAITNNVSLQGMIGYAAGFFSDPLPGYAQDYDSIVGQIEARWQISEQSRLAIGYDRGFFASFVGNYYSRDRGYLNFSANINNQVLLGADAEVSYLDFGTIIGPDGMPFGSNNGRREDIRLGIGATGEYRFTDWLAVTLNARYTGNFTDYAYPIDLTVGIMDPAQFNKFEVFGGLRIFY